MWPYWGEGQIKKSSEPKSTFSPGTEASFRFIYRLKGGSKRYMQLSNPTQMSLLVTVQHYKVVWGNACCLKGQAGSRR